MGFWTNLFDRMSNVPATPNANGPADYNPGDPNGLEIQAPDTPLENRSLPWLSPSQWSGWPSNWSTPDFATADAKASKLTDIAWACLDLNANVISSMPVYRTRNGQIIDPTSWMTNPDDNVYSCWQEFAKQLFWDFQMGEAFIMPMNYDAENRPQNFRVIPPFLVNVEIGRGGRRTYNIGSNDLTGEILHIRYRSSTADARGHSPLESALPRLVNIGLLQRYVGELAKTGGVPLYWMELERRITEGEGQDLLDRWAENRMKNVGRPALVGSGAKLNQARTMDAKEMGLLELSQFDESRIAVLLGVPPFLVGLAGASGSLTYSNIQDLFDYHDRSSLRPKVRMVMESLSNWALPRGQSAELNRDDYTRLTVDKRYAAYAVGIASGFLGVEEVRAFERLGPMPQSMIDALAAMQQAGAQNTSGQKATTPPARPAQVNGKQNTTAAQALSGGAN